MCWVLDRSVSKENGSPTLQALVSVGVLCGLFARVRLLRQKGKSGVMPESGSPEPRRVEVRLVVNYTGWGETDVAGVFGG